MEMKSDIEIAQAAIPEDIRDIGAKLGLSEDDLELYGKYKAKVDYNLLKRETGKRPRLILTTAINPTPAGEGKTTTTIGVADAMSRLGKNTLVALREPSIGPVFGLKGGAAGGGYAQVLPMEDINLHFTGDIHAITAANNLLAAMLDNHIQQGNELGIDPKSITWRRCMGHERPPAPCRCGWAGTAGGRHAETGRLRHHGGFRGHGRVLYGRRYGGFKGPAGPHHRGLHLRRPSGDGRGPEGNGAMTALLKDALKPNLVQTLEGTPAFVHGGPFANIAHGCNSIIATRMAMHFAGDYVITEAGFGADLGAEKFLDIKCRVAGLKPDAVIIVATIRALKYNGGLPAEDLGKENLKALDAGLPNLIKHIENITRVYRLPAVVAINRFAGDTDAEINLVRSRCREMNVNVALSEVWEKGGEGGVELAQEVMRLCDEGNNYFRFAYEDSMRLKEKIDAIATRIYGAGGVNYTPQAEEALRKYDALGFSRLPVCLAKTQYSLSDDAFKLGRPIGFKITVRDVTISAGAGFIVCLCGAIMKMPGLSKHPAAEQIDVDENGVISGLF